MKYTMQSYVTSGLLWHCLPVESELTMNTTVTQKIVSTEIKMIDGGKNSQQDLQYEFA